MAKLWLGVVAYQGAELSALKTALYICNKGLHTGQVRQIKTEDRDVEFVPCM